MMRITAMILGLILLILTGVITLARRQEAQPQFILFNSERDSNQKLYQMRLNGSNQHKLTNLLGYEFFESFTPDEQAIIFAFSWDTEWEIYQMGLDGRDPRNITNNPGRDMFGGLASDGQAIFFTSYRDGNWEIYQMDLDGSNPRNLTRHPANDYFAAFMPIIDLPWQPAIFFLLGAILCAGGIYRKRGGGDL